MAELHISNIDEKTMRRLRRRANREDCSIEDLVCALITEAAASPEVPSTAAAQISRAAERIRQWFAEGPILFCLAAAL